MRMGRVIREADSTGISGTGVVGEVVEWSDGTAVMRWLDAGVSAKNRERGVRPTTVIHDSVESLIALHGHDGATRIAWIA